MPASSPETPGVWLATGGAGYLGAHTVRALLRTGRRVVVLDDLSSGEASRVPASVPLIRADLNDRDTVMRTLVDFEVSGVLHFAARKSAPESTVAPLRYYRENVVGLLALLEAMVAGGVSRLVYSSSAAVYGAPDGPLVTEETAPAPINPYGESKLVGEWVISAAAAAHSLSWIALRYFNAVGTAGPELADRGESNLVPAVLRAVEGGPEVVVHGSDFPTPDGTALRDYIHAADLAEAHVAAVRRLEQDRPTAEVYNVGTGQGFSVLDVLGAAQKVTGRRVPYVLGPRRAGDPAEVVASVDKIRRELGWQSRYNLVDAVGSAWSGRRAQSRR